MPRKRTRKADPKLMEKVAVPTLRETTRIWELGGVRADASRGTPGRIFLTSENSLYGSGLYLTIEEAEWAITLLLQATEYLTGDVLEYPQLGNTFESRADV